MYKFLFLIFWRSSLYLHAGALEPDPFLKNLPVSFIIGTFLFSPLDLKYVKFKRRSDFYHYSFIYPFSVLLSFIEDTCIDFLMMINLIFLLSWVIIFLFVEIFFALLQYFVIENLFLHLYRLFVYFNELKGYWKEVVPICLILSLFVEVLMILPILNFSDCCNL